MCDLRLTTEGQYNQPDLTPIGHALLRQMGVRKKLKIHFITANYLLFIIYYILLNKSTEISASVHIFTTKIFI